MCKSMLCSTDQKSANITHMNTRALRKDDNQSRSIQNVCRATMTKSNFNHSWTCERQIQLNSPKKETHSRQTLTGGFGCSIPTKFSYRRITSMKRNQASLLKRKSLGTEQCNLNESWEYQPMKRPTSENMFLDLWNTGEGPTFDSMIDKSHRMDKPTMDQLIADIENTIES